ncbi:MAG: FAD-binding oxidoreductase [candidate division Zixibacteria bacterium]|nr:FAD-binding oxidoreductase [candidate division Zixibacteria bacterium]
MKKFTRYHIVYVNEVAFMREQADVVIIGGGIVGLSVAFYLAREKYGKIVVLEKEQFLGSGATSKAAGGIRAQFSTKVNIEMSMLSEKLFCSFKEDTGNDALFDQVGYMFLLEEEDAVTKFTSEYELQKSLGLNVELLKPDDIPARAPHVSLDGIRLATFCPDDGLGDPHEFLSGYEHVARQMGVEIEFEAEVTAITIENDNIKGISTPKGNISTPMIINCAGPQAGLIGDMLGVKVAVQPIKRQIVTTGALDFVKPDFPMVVDVKSGLYCHKESQGMLLGWADKSVQPSFDISLDPDYTDAILEKALERIPQLEEAEVANQWAGLYETTPDHHAIIGWDSKIKGVFHCAGFSGHGFMQAPAAGLVTSEVLTGKIPSVDISALAPDRFAVGTSMNETNVI